MPWLCVWSFFTHSLDYRCFYGILHLFELSLRWCIKVCTLTEGYIDGKDGKLCCNFTHSESLNFRNLNIPVETQKIDVLQVLQRCLRYHPSQKWGSAFCNQFFFKNWYMLFKILELDGFNLPLSFFSYKKCEMLGDVQ